MSDGTEVSGERFENPAASDGGAEPDEPAECATEESATEETPFFCRVQRALLRVAGVNSLWHWRIVHGILMLHLLAVCAALPFQPKYSDNSDNPQRPFLGPMRSYLLGWSSCQSVANLFFHRLLWQANASGRLTTSLPRSADAAKSHMGVAVIANAVAAFFACTTCLLGLLWFLGFLLVLPMIRRCSDGPWAGAPEVSPFSANWTVDFDLFTCEDHFIAQYDNATEAESACLEGNADAVGDERVCGGVGAEVCTQGLVSGPFYTCDARWLAVYDDNAYSCVAAPPGNGAWLR